jgi:hypothetical protein
MGAQGRGIHLKAAIPLFWFPFNSHPFEIRGLQKEEFIRELRE